MKASWEIVNRIQCGRDAKNAMFLCLRILFYAVIGALTWFVIGRRVLPGVDWLICFIGYPALLAGFVAGVIYLYSHEFP